MQVLQGIAILLIPAIGYFFAFNYNKKKEYTIALGLLVVCGFLLRIYTASDNSLHCWDERYHALVAKHLSSHFLLPTLYENPLLPFDYKNWTCNHIWLHKQPLALWLIAVSLRFFGLHPWAVRLPSVILSTFGIKLTYDVARHLYNRNTAFISAFLFSIHGLIIELTAGRTDTDHIDIAFLFFILLGIWSSVNYNIKDGRAVYTLLIGASIGAAVLTKWLPGIIVLPIWFILNYGRFPGRKIFKDLLLISLVAGAIAVPWQVYTLKQFPLEAQWELLFNKMHFFQPLEGHGGNLLFHFDQLRITYGELIYLPVIWFLYRTIKYSKRHDIAIAALFAIPYLFYTVAATKMPCYTLFAAPATFMITAEAYFYFRNATWLPRLMKLIAIFLLLLPIRYAVERIKPFNSDDDIDAATERKI